MRIRPALGVVILSLLGGSAAVAQTGGPISPARVLVMPFENVTREGRIVWLGEASAVLLADDLNAFGGNAITREERRQAFDLLQIPPSATLTDATAIRIAQIVAASEVVVGTIQLDGDQLVVRARAIAIDAGRLQGDVTERGAMPDVFALFERVTRQIMSPSAGGGAATLAHPPVAAFENYIKGLLAETPATAVNYLNLALQADPKFDRARLALWDVFDEQGDHDRALAAARSVPNSSDVARRARFLAGLSEINMQRNDAAFSTFKALADIRPTATVWNNLGVIQLRRGGTVQSGFPTYFFNKAAEADATEPDYFFNLGYAYWFEHDIAAAIYWLREAVRRDPADGVAHYVLGVALTAAGNATEASREKELARRLSSTYADWEKRPEADAVPKGLERIKHDVELPHALTIEETLASGGQRDQKELAKFYLDRAMRLYEQENDREALGELGRALFLSPYLAEAHLLVARIHLRGGRVHDAIDALKISLWSAETAEAHAVLAEAQVEAGDPVAARAEAERALAMDPASAAARRVLDTIAPR